MKKRANRDTLAGLDAPAFPVQPERAFIGSRIRPLLNAAGTPPSRAEDVPQSHRL
jgi:hypothetical protein